MDGLNTTLRAVETLSLHSGSVIPEPLVTPTVKLADIVFVLETQTETMNAYLDRATGEVHVVTEDDAYYVEVVDDEDIPEWQVDAVRVARAVAAGEGDYVELPTKFDIHEWSIMERFCREQPSEQVRERLLESIHGTGAFRMFRDSIRHLGLLEEWERYRVRALERIAIEWCETNDIPYDPAELPWLGADETNVASQEQRTAAANAERLLNEPIYTHATWRAKAGMSDELIAAWNVLGDLFPTLQHPPIEVTLIRRVDDPTVFHSIGSWRSLADAQAVSDSPQAIDALARIAALCSEGAPAVYEVVRRIRPE